MARRFVFHPVSPTTAAERAHDPALPLTKTQITKLSKTTPEDVTDARNWLKRMGLDDVVAMFDASVK